MGDICVAPTQISYNGYAREKAHLIDSEMRQKRLMVVDGKSLERVEHVDRQAHVVECPILAQIERTHERYAAPVGIVARKIRIEGEQYVDQRLWNQGALT